MNTSTQPTQDQRPIIDAETLINVSEETEVEDSKAELMDDDSPEGTQVALYNITLAGIAKLRDKYKEVPTDLSIKENYKFTQKAASDLRTRRTGIDKRRKELKADLLEEGRKIDGEARELTEALLEIETPFANAKKEYDTRIEIEKREKALAEERRVDGIAERIAGIKALVESSISLESCLIMQKIVALDEGGPADVWAEEFAEKAETTITETRAKLFELYDMKIQQETYAAEMAAAEAKRKAEEEEARKLREIEIAEQQAKIQEERLAMEAERQKLTDEAARIAKIAEEKAATAREEQAKKDAAAEVERKKLADEIEAMKQAQVDREKAEEEERLGKLQVEQTAKEAEKKQEDQPKTASVELAPIQETQQMHPDSLGYQTAYKASGNAMLKIIGNKPITKTLLDAIIAGEIANITFTAK